MKSSRRFLLVTLGLVVLAGLGGAYAGIRHAQVVRQWAGVVPPLPDLRRASEPFRARLAGLNTRAREDRDLAALGELAELYHANGYLREAEQAYRGLVRLDPANARWPHLLAALLAGYGRLDEAIPLLQRAVALAPGYAPARLRLGDSLLKSNRLDEAAAAYAGLLQISPQNPYGLLGEARIDLARDRLTAAREKLSRAVAANPGFFGAQSLLASVFAQLGDDDAADAARAHANQAGRFREAADPWLDALSSCCYDVYRLQVAAATAKSTGLPAEAVPLLQRALSLEPNNADTLRQLGRCYLQLGEATNAREPFARAVTLAPHDPASYLDLADYFRAGADEAGVIRTLTAGLAACSDTAALHGELGSALMAAHRPVEALPHFQAATELDPAKPEACRDLALTLFALQRTDEAASALQRGLELHPDFPPLLVLGARYQITRHQAAAAAALMDRAEHVGGSPGELARLRTEFQREFGRDP